MHHTPPFQAFFLFRLAAAALLIAAAVFAFTVPGHAAVFGRDDRARLQSADRSLQQSIGTLTASDTGAYCTAFCVAPDMIATASHCLFGTTAVAGPKLRDLTFKLSTASFLDRGTPIAGRAIANQSQHILSGTRRLAVAPPIGAADDWAVAQLETPACAAHALRLSTQSRGTIEHASSKGEIYQIAVHADLADTNLRRAAPCAVAHDFPSASATTIAKDFSTPDRILFHTCDTGGGSSGSPLLMSTPNGVEVVAINVGTYVLSRTLPTAATDQGTLSSVPIANTAIALPAIRDAVDELSSRELIQDTRDVRRLQSLLADKGFYHGAFNGRATSTLTEAIKRFEMAMGQPATGTLQRTLFALLDQWHSDHADRLAPMLSTTNAAR